MNERTLELLKRELVHLQAQIARAFRERDEAAKELSAAQRSLDRLRAERDGLAADLDAIVRTFRRP